jgi:uncharacterized RDD family membrane protein YckC
MTTATLSNDTEVEFPTLLDRMQSSFIDTMVIMMAMFAVALVLKGFEEIPDWVRITLFLAIWLVYEPLSTCMGATLGHYLKGIRVRSNDDYHVKINFLQAVVRYLIKITFGWISFLFIHSNDSRRALHDLAAGSVMIKRF